MKPVLIVEHMAHDGPGNFAAWLDRAGLAARIVRVHAGDPVPADTAGFAGLCVLGGDMGANDSLPHIAAEIALLRDAVARAVPVLGHCLGGQLLVRALGATVRRARAPELGWHPVRVEPSAAARRWFGDEARPVLMQWHYDEFSLPVGSVRLAGSAVSPNQAFEWERIHLAMQFHVEVDDRKAADWLARDVAELERFPGLASVQAPSRLAADTPLRIEPMRRLAWRIYDTWSAALRR